MEMKFGEPPSSNPEVYEARLCTAVLDQYTRVYLLYSLDGATARSGGLRVREALPRITLVVH